MQQYALAEATSALRVWEDQTPKIWGRFQEVSAELIGYARAAIATRSVRSTCTHAFSARDCQEIQGE